MQARYRADYAGEFVILESKWSGGKKSESREWIPNPIVNQHISGRAACIGSNVDHPSVTSAYPYDYTRLQNHRGGLLGSKKLQTYGTGFVALDMRLDFAVETHKENLVTLKDSGYSINNVVYTTPRNCILYPGEFYLIPYNPQYIDMATAVYLAAFDGHQEIFLLGYTNYVEPEHKDWVSQITSVFTAYPGARFTLVGEKTSMFDEWLNCANVQTMAYPEFISYCDC
jgi:hypothetical protein